MGRTAQAFILPLIATDIESERSSVWARSYNTVNNSALHFNGDHDPCILTDGVPGTGYTGYSCPPTAASPLCHSGLRNLPRSLHSKIRRTVKSLQSCIHSFVTSMTMCILSPYYDDILVGENIEYIHKLVIIYSRQKLVVCWKMNGGLQDRAKS